MQSKIIIARTILTIIAIMLAITLIKLFKWAIIPLVAFWFICGWAAANAFPSKK